MLLIVYNIHISKFLVGFEFFVKQITINANIVYFLYLSSSKIAAFSLQVSAFITVMLVSFCVQKISSKHK